MRRATQSRGSGEEALPAPEGENRALAAAVPPQSSDAATDADKLLSRPQHGSASEVHSKFSDEVHGYMREYIRNADQKAAFFFAALTALLAFLNSQHVPARWLKGIDTWTFVDGLGFVSMLGLAIGAGVLLSVVFPRLKGSRRGLFYFNAIKEYGSADEYVRDVVCRSAEDIVKNKLRHCFELSAICAAKYRMLQIGFWIGSVGALTGLLFLLLSKSMAS